MVGIIFAGEAVECPDVPVLTFGPHGMFRTLLHRRPQWAVSLHPITLRAWRRRDDAQANIPPARTHQVWLAPGIV
jgi:hypothetical protein